MMLQRMTMTYLTAGSLVAAAIFSYVAAPGQPAHAHSAHVFAAGEPGDPKKPNRVMTIEMREGTGQMSYSPDKIVISVGEQIRFVLKNLGELDHEFLLDSLENNAKHKVEMEKNPTMEHDEPNGARVKPKKSAEVLWRFTKPGTFEFACLIPGHYEAGMKGVVVVR